MTDRDGTGLPARVRRFGAAVVRSLGDWSTALRDRVGWPPGRGGPDRSVAVPSLGRVLPGRVRRSYLAKFGLALAVLVVLTAALGGYTQQAVADELEQDIDEDLTTVANLTADELGRWVDQRRQETRLISKSHWLATGARESAIEAEYSDLSDDVVALHYVDLETLAVLGSSDDVLGTPSLRERGHPWADRDLTFEKADSVYVSQPYRLGEDRTVMAFVSPVAAAEDEGVVVVADVTAVGSGFQSPVAGSFTRVVDDEGTVVFASDPNATLTQYVAGAGVQSDAVAAGHDGEAGVQSDAAVEESLGTDHVVAHAPVAGADWTVLVHAPRSNAYALVSTVSRPLIGMVVVILLGLGLVGVTLGRTTVRSVRDLTDAATAIAAGDLDAEVPATSREDELGDLTAAVAATRDYLGTVAAQADALAAQSFEDPVLEEEVPGALGTSLSRMCTDLQSLITDLERAREEAETSRREAERLTDALEQQADEFAEAMARAADGDFTQRLDPAGESEAMTAIAEAFNETLADLETTMAEVQTFARAVSDASDRVVTETDDVQEAAEQVAASIDSIDAGAREGHARLEEAATEVSDLSAAIQEVAAAADEAATVTAEAATEGERGAALATDSVETLDRIESVATDTVDAIERLEAEVTAIGEVVEVIDGVAEQTNMLALNASIEAARASEASEGFAVVASEVKQLAEETREATDDIEDRIGRVQETTTETVADVRRMETSLAEGIDTVEEALTALDRLGEHVQRANETVQSIDAVTDEQASTSQEVAATVESVAAISERTEEDATATAEAVADQGDCIDAIVATGDQLRVEANALTAELDRFETGADAATPVTESPSDRPEPAGETETSDDD